MREASLARTTLSRGGELSRGLEKETAAMERPAVTGAGLAVAGRLGHSGLVTWRRRVQMKRTHLAFLFISGLLSGCALVALFLSCNLSGSAGQRGSGMHGASGSVRPWGHK